MKRRSWQLALCGIVFAAALDNALAQQADYAAAARAAMGGAEIMQAFEEIPQSLLEKRKSTVLNMLPQAERPGFLSAIPRNDSDALKYYDFVENCIKKKWLKCL